MIDRSAGPVLQVDELSVDFGDAAAPALDGVSLALHRNEILGIVGETGAGKSVLGRAIINQLPGGGRVRHGDVRFAGHSVFDLPEAEQRSLRGGRIALIGTNPKALLDPVRPIGKQIADVLRAHKTGPAAAPADQVESILAQVGITNPARCAASYPHELSGGMAQRAVIAMALITRPEIVVADDATLGLDATIQVQVLDLLVSRCREMGLSVILITHDLGIVARYCDRVAIMERGRIVEIGLVDELFSRPARQETADLLQAARARRPPASVATTAPSVTTLQTPLISVENLTKTFPISGSRERFRAVDSVSFSIKRGRTMALVGESGSGKTTAGRCLVRLLAPDSGAIRFQGADIATIGRREFRDYRRRIQMVFQEPYVALNPRWRVEALIGEPLALMPELDAEARWQRIRELLALVRLPETLARAFPHELTAGEQKRVGIARALATNPDFVVFDEPTTALDIRVRSQIIDLIRDLQVSFGLTALFITHDLNSVRSLAHTVAVMQNGRIVETGETEQIFSAPQEQYTKTLLAAELPVDGAPRGQKRA